MFRNLNTEYIPEIKDKQGKIQPEIRGMKQYQGDTIIPFA